MLEDRTAGLNCAETYGEPQTPVDRLAAAQQI